MIRIITTGILAVFSTVTGTRADSASAGNDPTVDSVLEQLHQVGKNLREFSTNLKLTETDQTLGSSTVRLGRAYYQKTADGGARVHVVFDRRVNEETRTATAEKIEYLLDGPWLIDRNYRTKSEVRRQVLKPGQKLNLFKLGEGPFPLPIGQEPQEVHKQFDVKKVAPAKGDPPGTTHLELTPRPGTDLARKFHVVDVWVSEKTHMPVRVDTVDAKQQTGRSTELSDLVVNPPGGLKDADFQLPNIDQSWNRHVESLND